jgi:REP element-mobilizing transposase RayT
MGGIARKHGFPAKRVGGYDDHVHSLIGAPPTFSPSDIAQRLKGESSYWIRRTFPELKDFRWQDGYGVFTVSKSHIPKVIEYIKNQRIHHAKQSFEDEYLELLKLHEIEYDDRYVFD